MARQDSQYWQERMSAVMRSGEAYELLHDRYIRPFKDVVSLGGRDGVSQVFVQGDGERLAGIRFPDRYEVSRDGFDLSVTQHEMGHFVSVSERRCVMPGFGFGGGVPDLNFGAWKRTPVRPASGVVEAKAMAWEIVMYRDLHGFRPSTLSIVQAISHAGDFFLYPGDDDRNRYGWIAERVDEFVSEFGDISSFDTLWETRCRNLPRLLERETIRANLHLREPDHVERMDGFVDGWDAIVEHRIDRGVEEVSVMLDDGHDATFETFPNMESAKRWLEEIRTYYAEDEPSVAAGPAFH